MTCQRCHGLMVQDHLLDLEEAYGRLWIEGWRCVSCGDIVDPLIIRRRLVQHIPEVELAATVPVGSDSRRSALSSGLRRWRRSGIPSVSTKGFSERTRRSLN